MAGVAGKSRKVQLFLRQLREKGVAEEHMPVYMRPLVTT